MKLLTKEIVKALPKLYATDGVPPEDKIVVAKFFGGGRGTWLAVEYDGTDSFFGYVVSPLGEDCDELGYFSLRELQSARFPPFGLGIERDLYWKPKRLGDVAEYRRKHGPAHPDAAAHAAFEEA